MAPTSEKLRSEQGEWASQTFGQPDSSSSSVPVAVALGGTQGIGLGTAIALNRAFQGRLHIIFASRSAESSKERILAELPFPTGSQDGAGRVEFVNCDASSFGSVKALALKVKEIVESNGGAVNYVITTCGQLTTEGTDRTPDGVEKKLAMNYYSRFLLCEQLLPNMEAAREKGQPARFLSVLAPGRGGELNMDDFGLEKEAQISGTSWLRRSRWLREAEKAGVGYGDFTCEVNYRVSCSSQPNSMILIRDGQYLAKQHPNLSFLHTFPGFVNTGVLNTLPRAIRFLGKPLMALGYSYQYSGEVMTSVLLDPQFASGAFNRGATGQPLPRATWPGLESQGEAGRTEVAEKLWAHFKRVTA